jgi:hypothetical protein
MLLLRMDVTGPNLLTDGIPVVMFSVSLDFNWPFSSLLHVRNHWSKKDHKRQVKEKRGYTL